MKINKFFAFSYLGSLLVLFTIAAFGFMNRVCKNTPPETLKNAVDYISIPVAQVSGSVESSYCEYDCNVQIASPSAESKATSSGLVK